MNHSVNHSGNHSRTHSWGEGNGREWKGMEKDQKIFMASSDSERELRDAHDRDDAMRGVR